MHLLSGFIQSIGNEVCILHVRMDFQYGQTSFADWLLNCISIVVENDTRSARQKQYTHTYTHTHAHAHAHTHAHTHTHTRTLTHTHAHGHCIWSLPRTTPSVIALTRNTPYTYHYYEKKDISCALMLRFVDVIN